MSSPRTTFSRPVRTANRLGVDCCRSLAGADGTDAERPSAPWGAAIRRRRLIVANSWANGSLRSMNAEAPEISQASNLSSLSAESMTQTWRPALRRSVMVEIPGVRSRGSVSRMARSGPHSIPRSDL